MIESDIDYIVVHASATTPEMDVDAALIRDWHTFPCYINSRKKWRYLGQYYDFESDLPLTVARRRGRGWSDIGYHFVIKRDGTLEPGRALDRAGAHVKGLNNRSWGICMVGGVNADNKPDNNFTDAQFKTLDVIVSELIDRAPTAEAVGHRDLSPDKNHNGIIEQSEWLKVCPCFDVKTWWEYE